MRILHWWQHRNDEEVSRPLSIPEARQRLTEVEMRLARTVAYIDARKDNIARLDNEGAHEFRSE